jgi:G3E family GTPase
LRLNRCSRDSDANDISGIAEYLQLFDRKKEIAMQDTLCSVVLIAGFLGAGKTTLLANILNWPGNLSGTAILVNEFGAVGIDGELLQGFDAPVVEMANGCICCSLQVDFRRSVEDILVRFHPNRLLIEATGVADPHDILAVLNEARFRQKLNPARTVTVVDADFWEAREHFGPLFYNQIRAADLILLNKVDLQSAELVTKFISAMKEVCPSSSIMPTHYCRIDPDALWGLQKQTGHNMESLFPMYMQEDHGGGNEHHHGESNAHELGYVTFSFETSAPFSEECFRLFMASAPAHLYRIKGYVFFGGKWVLVNHVGGKTEWGDSSSKDRSRLAFVGWQVDEKPLLARLKECLIE